MHLARKGERKIQTFSETLAALSTGLKTCSKCYAYADAECCEICGNPARNPKVICVVESIRDLMAIEETQQYNGLYHVLNGLISPVDGIGPDQLNIQPLLDRIISSEVEELIMAIRPCIEGDTTVYYLSRQLSGKEVRLTMIARGIAFGSELEFADEFTLGRSIAERIPYSLQVK